MVFLSCNHLTTEKDKNRMKKLNRALLATGPAEAQSRPTYDCPSSVATYLMMDRPKQKKDGKKTLEKVSRDLLATAPDKVSVVTCLRLAPPKLSCDLLATAPDQPKKKTRT
jgi:hypothetical protein